MTSPRPRDPDADPITSRGYTVVVGMGRRGGSPAALQWALEEAHYRDGVVFAVRAWRAPRPPAAVAGRPPLVTVDAAQDFEAAESALAADVAAAVGPGSGVECRVVHGSRKDVLIDASARADLLVIDVSPRTDRRSSPRFAQRLVHRSACPVVVMPEAIGG